MYERNDVKTLVNNDRIFWLNVKHIEEELDHKSLQKVTLKFHSNHKKHRCELVEEPKK